LTENERREKIKTNTLSFPGKIHLITNDRELAAVSEAITSAKILGFDTETKPSYVKGQVFKVALLQLSTEDNCYLIRLHKVTQFEPLIQVFENPAVVLTGVAIHDDIKALQKTFKFSPKNFVELQQLAKEKGLTKFGLKNMSEELLEGTVFKGPKMTNWERRELTEPQLLYAATDAWIGLKLYEKLKEPSQPAKM